MTQEEYNRLLDILERHIIHNSMMIGGIQYNLIDLYGFKKELKIMKGNKEQAPILDKSKIQKR